jgi:hypothetical protein
MKDTPSTDIYRVTVADTYTIYTKNGQKHRVNGPALSIGGKDWYYIEGTPVTSEEHATYRELNEAYGDETDALYTPSTSVTDED